MKNESLFRFKAGTFAIAALSLALPGAGGAQPISSVGNHPVKLTATQAGTIRQINPTTVEVELPRTGSFTFDFYGENIVRLFQDKSGGILREPQASPEAHILVPSARRATGGVSVKETADYYEISTPKVCIHIDRKTELVSVRDLVRGETVIEEVAPVQYDGGKTTLSFSARPNEYFYGGGVQNGRFSHRGRQIAIENTNNWVDGGVASPTPFYWSTKGYGLMWYTFRPGLYDFGATETDKVTLTHSENYLDVFLMVNEKPESLLADFYQLTGNPVLLPKFGFYPGHLNAYNRDYWTPAENGFMLYEDGRRYNESQKDNGGIKESLNGELPGNYQFSARAAIDRYLNADMPLGWFLPNDGYGAGYGQTPTLEGNVENLKQFGDYARSYGVEIGLWTQSDLHPKEGIEALLQRDIVREVRDAGVRVLKTDVAWVGAGYSFGLNGVADVGEIMPYYGSNARPFIISLDGWAGTQRYAGIWSGDQTGGDWEYIRFHIPTFIGSGLSGQPNITNDMDGIFGGKNLPVNVRDFQWKTFTPMELNMDGWGSNPKYPQALGEPATSINRHYLKLKSELMPYAYTVAHEAVAGKPMIRALFLEYPTDYTLGTATGYEFLYGSSFLVAPVYKETRMDEQGNDVRNGIYLPEGRWIDYWNGDVYEGGRIINEFAAPIWKLPVFVKAGSIIPMAKPHNNPSQCRKDYRIYEFYPIEGVSSFTQYDDDGVTQEYLSGASTRTTISSTLEKGKLTVQILPVQGDYNGFEPRQQTELRINVSEKPKKVTATLGKKKVALTEVSPAEFENAANAYCYDPAPELNQFATPGSEFSQVSIKKNPQLRVKLSAYDVTASALSVNVDGYVYSPADPLRKTTGALSKPVCRLTDENIGAYEMTPAWEAVPQADYYEIEFDGQLYSTIRSLSLPFEGLTPETSYTFKVRAVNRDGYSAWTEVAATTKSNPLEFAQQGIRATISCEDQPGQDIGKLFDFDEKSGWHTKWGKGEAVPFEVVMDLRGVAPLDRIDYLHREDGGNGVILEGTFSTSLDKQTWSKPVPFSWTTEGTKSVFAFEGNPQARYIRMNVTKAIGNFGSGNEMYVFRVADSEIILQGDINRDKRIDENDLTSYMNYTGLRRGDGDFDYVSIGDVNGNGLIDAYDISVVTTELDGGVRASADHVEGSIVLTPNKTAFKAGDIVEIKVTGKQLHAVNAFSFGLPYDSGLLEYVGVDLVGTKEMVNLTYDRLHTNGTKALYPTFVNRGNNFLLDDGNPEIVTLKFRARKAGKWTPAAVDGILVDRNLGSVGF